MKKALALLLGVAMVLSLAACGGSSSDSSASSAAPAAASSEAAAPAASGSEAAAPAASGSEAAAPAASSGEAAAPAASGSGTVLDFISYDDSRAAGFESYYLGTNTWGSGVPILEMIGDAAKYTIESVAGCTYTYASDDFTSDLTVQNIQRFIGSEIDGGALYSCASTTVPTVSQMCEEAKIPFSLHTGVGVDDQVEMLQANPYFAGSIDANNVLAGEKNAQLAYEQGCRTAVMIGGNVGDINMDQRSEGFTKKFTELGGQVLDESRCTDPSEATTKAGDLLSANRDTDCVFCFVGDYVPGAVTAKDSLGLDNLKIYVANVDEESAQYIKDGVVSGGTDGTTLPPMLGVALVLNYMDGAPIVDETGKCPHMQTIPLTVDQSNVDLYMQVFCTDGRYPIADGLMKTLLYRFNENCNYDTWMEAINNIFTIENFAAAHGIG